MTTPLKKFAGFLIAVLVASAAFQPSAHAATAPLSDAEASDLTFMREEEKLARDESLLCGSRNHLRAFAAGIEAMTGQAYVPQLAESDPAEISLILAGPMEKCG